MAQPDASFGQVDLAVDRDAGYLARGVAGEPNNRRDKVTRLADAAFLDRLLDIFLRPELAPERRVRDARA